MKRLIILLLMLCSNICIGQSKKDTVFLLKEFLSDGSYHVVFVENNKHSHKYMEIKDTSFDKKKYVELLSKTRDSLSFTFVKQNLGLLDREWYPLMLYKHKYYLYIPSDSGINPWVTFTDSTMIEMYFDPGVLLSVIKNIHKISKSKLEVESTNIIEGLHSIKIHIIDRDKGIAIFERPYWPDSNRFTLMISKSHIKNYPIIVNYCKDSRTDEWKFDIPDFAKLLHKKY